MNSNLAGDMSTLNTHVRNPLDPRPNLTNKTRILFFAEAVTLAHMARPFMLASGLDPAQYDIHFACDDRYRYLFPERRFNWHPLNTIASKRFIDALAKGAPVYDAKTLHAYVRADLELIDKLKPDLVVGDFRLSLAVSAPLAKTPYLTIANAYWSPFAKQRFTVPDLPLARLLGVRIVQDLFRAIRPLAFAYHTVPLNRVRMAYGLSNLGLDLRRIYTYADYTLYADIPELTPTFGLPENHYYLGPTIWSPAVDKPTWWNSLPKDRPIIYVNLGSSGASKLLPVVLASLAKLDVTVIVATAGLIDLTCLPTNVHACQFLPGDEATALANLVISNGGSMTTQQAMALGVPVLGIAGNLDQLLNMNSITASGAGITLHSAEAREESISCKVKVVLENDSFYKAAGKFQTLFAQYSSNERFSSIIRRIMNAQDNPTDDHDTRKNICEK